MVPAIGTRERVGGATADPRRGAAASFTSPLAQRLSRSLSRDAGRREQRSPTFLIVDATSPDKIHLTKSRHHQNRFRFDGRDQLCGEERYVQAAGKHAGRPHLRILQVQYAVYCVSRGRPRKGKTVPRLPRLSAARRWRHMRLRPARARHWAAGRRTCHRSGLSCLRTTCQRTRPR